LETAENILGFREIKKETGYQKKHWQKSKTGYTNDIKQVQKKKQKT
jgi:hypothetical protein